MKAGFVTGESVCAVIVTYHPSATMLEIVPRVLAQVDGLVVVDNGSNTHELIPLRAAKEAFGFQLIENGENLGIAEALNQGVRWVKSNDFGWVIFFDQDSQLSEGFVGHMFAAWRAHPDRERVGSLHSRHVAPNTGVEVWVPRTRDGSPILPMTSGSLMPVWIFDKVGWFASEYFIDVVDWEYSFRTRVAGYAVADAKDAALFHTPGNPVESVLLGHTFRPSNHSALRRYYLTRNRIVFYRKYFRAFPAWVLSTAYHQFKETIVCLLVEPNRIGKLRNMFLGAWDAFRGRMGKRAGL
jgi:rhamnosyltransferase